MKFRFIYSLFLIGMLLSLPEFVLGQDKSTSTKKGNFEKNTFSTKNTPPPMPLGPPDPGGGGGGTPIPISGGFIILSIGSALYLGNKIKKEYNKPE